MSDMNETGGQDVMVVTEPRSVLENAPWWLISAGFHVVLLLAATLVCIERMVGIDEGGIIVSATAPSNAFRYVEPPKSEDQHPSGAPSNDPENPNQSMDKMINAPDFELGDHNESDENMDGHTMRGQSPEAMTSTPGRAIEGLLRNRDSSEAGTVAALGVGPGGGDSARHGTPFGGGRKNIRNSGITGTGAGTKEDAIMKALKWLARHQSADGSWSADRFGARCHNGACPGTGDACFDTGVTGLALLAFLGGGFTHLTHDDFPDPVDPSRTLHFGEVVKRAERWLIANQAADGSIGVSGNQAVGEMYNHAICTIALSEAYGLTSLPFLREPTQRAVDFLVAAQNPGKGWRYHSRSGDNDVSVTGWAVMALKSADLSGLSYPQACYTGATAWLDEATDNNGYYRVGYNRAGTGLVHNSRNGDFQHHESMSAVSIVCRIFMQKNRRDPKLGCATLLMNDLPEWKDRKIDYYYWYYASLGLFHMDGPEGPMWKKWSTTIDKVLTVNQKTDATSCQHGSWDPQVERWNGEGGRVYATAINALTLETIFRYELFARK